MKFRRSMSLAIRNGQRTPSSTPDTSPVAEIDISTPMIHTIYFTDSGTGEKAKPRGVHGCEIWVKVGDEEPKTGSEYSFLDPMKPPTTLPILANGYGTVSGG